MNIEFCSINKKNNNFFLKLCNNQFFEKFFPKINTAPIPAGTIIFNSQINVTPMVSPNTLAVNGANTKIDTCHLNPNSTREMVGKIDSNSKTVLTPIAV